ncbi:hypothetical protein VSDG_00375 [Cytospora chrysosperma]|uniref:NmrA-like domain-containing protein n=1 Tax=Cytospora chrysosperma TaxID=252740 RepID=A0A423WNQ4_CYTCH|nr:hypothetical protein VSDG_00375 [Valsa sordida]
MAQEYASQKPKDYSNHVKKVAVVGVTGQVGSHIVEHLLKNGKHEVTAITRKDGSAILPDGIKVSKVDYSESSTLVDALRGQDALIITLSVLAPQDTQSKLIEAAAAAEIPWIIPNQWGSNPDEKEMSQDKVTFYDDGQTKINTTTWPQCGRAIANLLALKVLPEDEKDESPTLSQFKNETIYISSFLISQKDMFESVLRVTGGAADHWTISYQPSVERYREGVEAWQKGDMRGFAQAMYARIFYQDGCGNYEAKKALHNKLLGLPKEDLDEFTAVAVEMAKADFLNKG